MVEHTLAAHLKIQNRMLRTYTQTYTWRETHSSFNVQLYRYGCSEYLPQIAHTFMSVYYLGIRIYKQNQSKVVKNNRGELKRKNINDDAVNHLNA